VVVTHGQLAIELVNAAEMIVGDLPRFAAVSIGWHDDVDIARAEVERAIARVSQGAGVLLTTDMFGGTPTNIADARALNQTYTATATCSSGTLVGGGVKLTAANNSGLESLNITESSALNATTWEVTAATGPITYNPLTTATLTAQAICAG